MHGAHSRLEARAPLRHRSEYSRQLLRNSSRLRIAAASDHSADQVLAFDAQAPVIAITVANHKPLGQLLGLALGPAPAHQPGAPVEKPCNVGLGPGHRRKVEDFSRCALRGAPPLRILRILRRPA